MRLANPALVLANRNGMSQPEVNRVPLKSPHLFDRLVLSDASSQRTHLVKNHRYRVFDEMELMKIIVAVAIWSCAQAAREGK
jgi:hypothetical protein